MVDLNSLVHPPSDAQVFDTSYINQRGEITGNAILPNGDEHAVLLIPTGESRIAVRQPSAAIAPRPKRPRLSPVERARTMMRQRFHLHGQPRD